MANSGDWVKALGFGILLSASISAASQHDKQRARAIARPGIELQTPFEDTHEVRPQDDAMLATDDGQHPVGSERGPSDQEPTAGEPSAQSAEEETSAPRLRRLKQAEVTRAVVLQARRIIKQHYQDPFGTEIPFSAEGRAYVARIERHYHPPGGEALPWGEHAGVSVFVKRELNH